MGKSNIFKRALSFLLSFAMVFGTFTITASAGTVFEQKKTEVGADPTSKFVITGQPYYGNDPANPRYDMDFQEDTKVGSKIRVRYQVYMPHEEFIAISTLAIGWDDLIDDLETNGGVKVKKNGEPVLELINPSPVGKNYKISSDEQFIGFDDEDAEYDSALTEWADEDNDLYAEFDLVLEVTNQETFQSYLKTKGTSLKVAPQRATKTGWTSVIMKRGEPTPGYGYEFDEFPPEDIGIDNENIQIDLGGGVCQVTYKVNGATTIENLPDPNPVNALINKEYKIPKNIVLKKTMDIGEEKDVPHVLSGWDLKDLVSDEEKVVDKEGSFIPKHDVTLTARYAPDRNDDGEDDNKQVEVTYSVKSGSEAGIEKVTYKVADTDVESTEFTDMSKLKSVVLKPDTQIGDKAADVKPKAKVSDTDDVWKFKQYNVTTIKGGSQSATYKTLEELRNHTVPNVEGAKQNVEIQMMKDNNGNDVDDDDLVTVTVKYEGVEKGTVQVPDKAKDYFIVFPDGSKTSGNIQPTDKDPVTGDATINLTEDDVPPRFKNTRPLEGDWTIGKADENNDGTDDVMITPSYKAKADDETIDFPGPVIDGTDPDKTDDDIMDDPDGKNPITLQGDAIVVFLYDKDNTADRIPNYGAVTLDQIKATSPKFAYPAHDAKFPKKLADGSPFVAWKIVGLTAATATQEFGEAYEAGEHGIDQAHYFAYPVYDKTKVELKIVQPADPTDKVIFPDDPATPVEVPVGTEIVVQDENGNDGDKTTVTKADKDAGKTVTLPADDTMPATNDAGDFFKGEWKVEPVDTDSPADGIPDKYVVTPVYDAPNPDDVEIIPDPEDDPEDPTKPDAKNELTGNGYKVLKGAVSNANDYKATAYFYAKAKASNGKSAPVGKAQEGNVKAVVKASNGFTGKSYGTMTQIKFDKEVDLNGEKYGRFVVEYTMTKSGIVTITTTFAGHEGAYDIILVGNADKKLEINTADVKLVKDYIAKTPKSADVDGNAGYKFELANVDKKLSINTTDVKEVKKLITTGAHI